MLDVNDLINIAKISSEFTYIASNIYHRKYADYEIRIERIEYEWHEEPYSIEESPKYIIVRDFQLASDMLKYFGNRFRNLFIRNDSSRNYTLGSDWATINQFVNEYASESVVHLKLNEISKELWSLFTIPFTNVEALYINIKTDTDGMKLNQLCPNMKEFHIDLINAANYDSINCELPHLQHLDISISMRNPWNKKDQILGLIRNNPQIRSIVAVHTPPTFIRRVSEYLPNLKYLTLQFHDDQNGLIHFDSVRHCVLYTNTIDTLKNLSFLHLESLQMQYSPEELDKFTEFFLRHKSLKRLTVLPKQNTQFQLNLLTVDLVNLVEMTVEFHSDINIDNVTKFIENHPKLIKFQFKPNIMESSDWEVFCKKFEQDWHIVSIEQRNAFSFERKKML